MGGETGLCCVCVPGPVTVRYQSHGYGLGGKGRILAQTRRCASPLPAIRVAAALKLVPSLAVISPRRFRLASAAWCFCAAALLRLLVLQPQPLLQLVLPQLLLLLHPHPLWRMDW